VGIRRAYRISCQCCRALAVFALFVVGSFALADDNEVALFDQRGEATAYIALNDELTIYLWSGIPVAYLDRENGDDFHVYGFNGKHLGWFVGGIIWGHDGNAGCAVKDRLQFVQLEPLKALKQLKPIKSLEELAPLRPLFTTSWGRIPCRFLFN
jgi:hypothetical protein